MSAPSGDLQPQRVLTPRRKRTFLSFRRKSDLVWFLASLVMFSGGVTAFFLAVFFIGRPREPIPVPVAAPLPVPTESPLPELPVPPPAEIPEKKGPPPAPPSRAGDRGRASAPRVLPRATAPPPVAPSDPNARPYVLFHEVGTFKTLVENRATIDVEQVQSVGEPAIQLTYDLAQGNWVQCYVNIRENFSGYSRVQFLFSGEGAKNTLEFKIVDADGTVAGMSWPQQTGKKGWNVVDLLLSDLPYLRGGNSTLDLKRVRQIYFSIAVKPGDRGGHGRVTIRGVTFS